MVPIKIAQLSDCHLQAEPHLPYRGQDPDANLEQVLEIARAWGPELLLLSGDLSEDASVASYQRLSTLLETNIPVLALPGNHDDPAVMRQHFPHGPWGGPLCFETQNWAVVLIDSIRPGRIDGELSAEALEQIENTISESPAEHLLLALHHQPVPVAAPWIDRHALKHPGGFLGLIDREPRVRCVVWGHIHHHFAEDRDGVLFLGAPSTAANSLARSQRFSPDPAGPACRTLELEGSGGVVYGQLGPGHTT